MTRNFAPLLLVAVLGWWSTGVVVAAESRDSAMVTTIAGETIELTVPASVDLHISITSRKPVADARSEALEFLKSIVVNEKN
jgi:hypothetical protein